MSVTIVRNCTLANTKRDNMQWLHNIISISRTLISKLRIFQLISSKILQKLLSNNPPQSVAVARTRFDKTYSATEYQEYYPFKAQWCVSVPALCRVNHCCINIGVKCILHQVLSYYTCGGRVVGAQTAPVSTKLYTPEYETHSFYLAGAAYI